VTKLKSQLTEAYKLTGINRNQLSNSQQRFVDKILTLLIRKCNQDNKPINSIPGALEELAGVIKDDPLFKPG